MLEILQFIFSNFWVFLGCIVLGTIACTFASAIICEFMKMLGIIIRGQPSHKTFLSMTKEDLEKLIKQIEDGEIVKKN
ncbi:MAG: hypothetical protein LBF97_02230 [Elusimicrobiota bacterium]|jgi:hypothetical protein|nr:hypothetical protein [Elusimicrobiota bacterium]